jgi:hypothetical protein
LGRNLFRKAKEKVILNKNPRNLYCAEEVRFLGFLSYSIKNYKSWITSFYSIDVDECKSIYLSMQ